MGVCVIIECIMEREEHEVLGCGGRGRGWRGGCGGALR